MRRKSGENRKPITTCLDSSYTNWTYLDTPFSNTGFSEVQAIDAHNGQVLVCAKRFGDAAFKIYYSSDNGAVWHECTKAGYRMPNTTYVALNPHQPGHFWVATNGRTYVVESSPTLGVPADWQPLTNFTTSDAGSVRTITDLGATGASKFYRVRITGP